jgi:stearoyl-CoA desaturase (delta-9 desaturase)
MKPLYKTITRHFASSTTGAQLFLLFSLSMSSYVAYLGLFDLPALALIILGYFLYGCLGIVVTYHRHLTHSSYKTSPLLVRLFSLLGCFAGTGSPLAWANIHINHHLYSDNKGDPHSPRYYGLKIFSLNYRVEDKSKYLRHIIDDGFQRFLHRYYFVVLLGYSLVLYMVGGLYLLVFAHLLPAIITAIMSNVVNYVGHKPGWPGGYRSFNLNDQSTNNWLWAIPSWGESWHNNHHRFPKDYTFSKKWWEFDISGLIIKLIKT